MPSNESELQAQARNILDTIVFTPFEQCQPLSREFSRFPARPGIYAIRHKNNGLLYVGKTKSLRGRFSGGHKAFLWAWLDKYNDEDVRIALQVIPYWGNPALLLELEAIILRAKSLPTTPKSQPRGKAMQAKSKEQLSPPDAEAILDRLPERIRVALIARATEIEYPVEAVVEMAIASFLDSEAIGFADCKPGRGQ
jgi:hypothetical protein